MSESKIEWTDRTWNPVRGCSLVSAGCENCYAMKQAHRFSGPGGAYEGLTEMGSNGPRWNGKIQLLPDVLEQPLRWKKPRKVFVNSMSDLFHPDVPFDFIDKVFAVMALCPQHTFQILTKRPERMREYFTDTDEPGRLPDCREAVVIAMVVKKASAFGMDVRKINWDNFFNWPLPNVWLGVSVEDQKTADERIPILLETPAAVRFVSYEPALGPVDFETINHPYDYSINSLTGKVSSHAPMSVDPTEPGSINKLDWVIAGGESGASARPMHPDWMLSVRDQCQAAGVPFFFKQWGEWAETGPIKSGDAAICTEGHSGPFTKEFLTNHSRSGCHSAPQVMYRIGKKTAGRLLDGREHNEFPGVV